MRERFAGDEFHDDANLPFDVEQIVEFDGVWMRNFAIGTGFVHESFDDDFIAIKLGMEFFDGDELTGEDVMHWWMEDGVLPGQMVFEGMEDI